MKISSITGYCAYSQGTVSASIDVSKYKYITITCSLTCDGNYTHVDSSLSVTGNISGLRISMNAGSNNGYIGSSNTQKLDVSRDTTISLQWTGSGSTYSHQNGEFTNIVLSNF